MMNDIKRFDPTTIDEATAEELAIKAQKRLQAYHDRKETGQLTDEEKRGIENNDRLAELIGNVGLENLTVDMYRSVIQR